MAAKTGRTTRKYFRIYGGNSTFGLDFSTNATQTGDIGTDYEEEVLAPYSAEVKGVVFGEATNVHPAVNAILETNATTSAIHDYLKAAAGSPIYIADCFGVREVPTYGTIAYVGAYNLRSYKGSVSTVSIMCNLDFSSQEAGLMNYTKNYGQVAHPLGAETAANTGTSNVLDNGGASTAGGYLFYCLTSLNAGNVTLSLDDSANGTDYAALSGATSGALTAAKCGIVQLATTATVRQYIRWQAAFAGGANTATFMLAFVRG